MKKLALTIGVLLLLVPTSPLANHSIDFSWMGWCCGKIDCIVTPVSILEFREKETHVLANGVELVLPPSTVRESEDGHIYWCGISHDMGVISANTRCVFYTVGG